LTEITMNQTGNKRVESITTGSTLSRPNSPEAVLRDLASLLEEYGPTWYTEDHHRRIQAALRPDPARRSAAALGAR
jgi:hypothetical protein